MLQGDRAGGSHETGEVSAALSVTILIGAVAGLMTTTEYQHLREHPSIEHTAQVGDVY